MWILFGTNWDTVENEPYVYFIGIFDNLELAYQERKKLLIQFKVRATDYFIKEAQTNQVYDHDWSNLDD